MSDNIKVVVKVRPLIFREIEDKLSYQWRINNNTLYQVDQNGRDCGPSFTFDKVYDTETRTDAVYNDIAKPIVEAATAGFNGTIFAYGQTSSGKTYTMTGTDDAPGIIPLAVLNLFDIIRNIPDRDFLVRVSYVEIYNESFIDLLDLTKKVKIQETLQGIKVCTTEKLTISPEEVLELMRQGKANRQTGSTNMNDESSRSHSIFQITIESREHIEGEQEVGSVNVSQLNLVDLAGSERSGQTGATGIRFKEGTHINKSLSSLALVIKQLSEDPNKHVNYRDSKLTRILQNSLGGNAKTSIICAVTPAAVEETISTLQFANRAKAIKNTPAVNLVTTNATMIQSLTKQLSSLKTQLESKKNVEQDNYNLQKQIANLQKMILNGFGQNRNTDIISTARRKLIQPRRVTISTLHPIQEDPVPLVPKFCTPSLKYNPMSVGVVSENVCREPAASTHADVIEIDSDDEKTSDIEPCSPYHKCYKSKTPPCVLRKYAKQAEKNLMDIVELTEREKIYTPNVAELMEQLEHKSLALTKLEDNISNLHSVLKDKDQEMEILKGNITEVEDEIKSIALDKAKLETTCNNYSTKITDWEVSFETLKKKSKSREDELLSLLKEHEIKKKNETIGKLSSKAVEKELKNFLDLSRDISLVNSSVENSIIESETRQNCCADMRTQVTLRDQTISQLEANLHKQKLKIENLENINEKLQVTVSNLNDKLSLLETENSNLKYSMDGLNNTITSQKSLIEIANTEIESYCSVIRGLQNKINKKEDKITDISDTDLEAMIANEEMFIANNENMKNIIQSLKVALDSRNKEIKKLKSNLDNNQNLSSLVEFDSKKNEISALTNDVERLKKEVTNNVSVIDTLLQEKNKMIHLEEQLTLNFTAIQEQKDLLDKEIEVHIDEMAKLKVFNNKLTTEVKAKQEEIISINKENDIHNKDLCQKIFKLEATLKNKEGIIASLKKDQIGTRENIEKAKLGLAKVQNIITLLTGDINVIPEFVDDLVVAFSTLGDNLTSLESIAKDTIKDKKYVIAKLEQSEIEINTVLSKINGMSDTVDKFYNEYETLMLGHLNEDKFANGDMNACDKLNNKINNLLSVIETTQKHLNQTISDKNAEIKECKFNYENKSKELNEESQKNISQMQQICDLKSSRNLILKNVFEKVTNLTFKFCIENNINVFLCEFENDCQNVYGQVILTIDKIDNYISQLQLEHSKCGNIEHVLEDAKIKILQLTEENLKLVKDISDLETNKANLSDEIEKVQKESKYLRDDLKGTNNLLNQLRENLNIKSSDMEFIESKAKSWKDSFTDLECMMQDKINLLEAENLKLKSKCSELEMQDLQQCYNNEESLASGDQECYSRKKYIQVNSPPSLLTICCNRIADAIDLNDDKSVTSSSSFTELSESKMSINKCNCKDLLADLQKIMEEKNNLNITIERLQNENEDLLNEREDVQKEVQLLLEHSHELQKRVVNHRTILSTLTATTYAENKLLSSQIKFFQHNHSRYHHVCQKVIPDVKSQLYNLMTLLKSECLGKHNESFKRYSLPNALDTSSLHSTFKNESIFDNDLLMLDTNVTLTTCDNTMTAHDQTCFDVTQVWVSNEVACQTNISEVTKDPLYPQMGLQPLDENKILETLESLKTENDKLRDLVDDFNKSKVLVTTLSSPIKFPDTTDQSCKKCNQHVDDIRVCKASHKNEIDAMSKKLLDLECEKNNISEKWRNLALEVPSSEVLVRRLGALEKELQIKLNEIERLSVILSKTDKTLKSLQDENESLSNEIMENISEIDDLKNDQDNLKETNTKLTEKLCDLEKELKSFESEKTHKTVCNNCALKDEIIKSLQKSLLGTESHSKLDRSYSDADSSSRYNKICTLQNELHASKEDCIELKEEVTTIKKHLEHSNLSISQNMDLDESIIDSHMYSFNKDFGNTSENKFNLLNVPEERVIDAYILDKTDCLNYYCEKTGIDKETLLNGDFKILEVMKMLYVNFSTKHANEIQNLVNKLKDFEEAKSENNLQAQFDKIKEEQSALLKELKEKDGYINQLAEILSHMRDNNNLINEKLGSEDALIIFRTTFLKLIDTEFGLTSSNIFESIIQQLNEKHNKVMEINTAEIGQLKETTQRMVIELKSVNDNLLSLKSQLNEKETEFALLQRQKEKMHEISNAVTIDIIRKEKELKCLLTQYYRKLLESNIIKEDIDLTLPLNESMNILFNFIINRLENKESEEEKLKIISELENLKTSLLQKDEDLRLLKDDFNKIVKEHEQKLVTQTSLHNDLNKIYTKKVEENEIIVNTINKLTEENDVLKSDITSKDALVKSLETKHSKDLLERQSEQIKVLKNLRNVQKELEDLKSINQNILMEKKACAIELDGVKNILIQKNLEIDKFVSEIDKLKHSMHENSQVIENLKLESDALLQKQLQEKCTNCVRLETNIKTHEKTASIQISIINRLQVQKADFIKGNIEKDKQIETIAQKCKSFEEECLKLTTEVQTAKEEIEKLSSLKQTLELRISELETLDAKPRLSIDSVTDTTRRRRQSIHDSKRIFADDVPDHQILEAMSKSRSKSDDLFMDIDEDSSSRSTPIRLSRGRDSHLSKHDQSDKDEEPGRPGSAAAAAAAARRRRRTAHDTRRGTENSFESSGSFDGEAAHFRRLLTICQEELEELRQRYKEVDEECETCAQYLRERDEQCLRLKKEKGALENTIMDLREKMKTMNSNDSTNTKITFTDASVNTEEDWTNLHSVFVDRMSYDAEVEKNKKLMRTIEELRFKKQDLKNTMTKMQKALDKKVNKESQELESMTSELAACKQELEELKERYKELDEECETCAEYLRERDEQCQKLKETKAALENKLEEYQDSSIVQSIRKRRQTLHDQNRRTPGGVDVATETSDDLLSYQVEKDDSKLKLDDTKEIKRLKMVVDKLSLHKPSLEQQLSSVGTQYVATGSAIVQNQQLSDVMKENQKLKKINAKLVTICKKRGKSLIDSNIENEDPSQNNENKN